MQAFIREKQNRGHRETHITEEKEVQKQKNGLVFRRKDINRTGASPPSCFSMFPVAGSEGLGYNDEE